MKNTKSIHLITAHGGKLGSWFHGCTQNVMPEFSWNGTAIDKKQVVLCCMHLLQIVLMC